MTEGTKDVQPKGESPEQDMPIPEIGGSSEGESSAASGLDVDALAQRIREEVVGSLPDMIDARFKSAKDKRFSMLENLSDDFKTLKQYLDDANGNEAMAARNYRIDKLLNEDQPEVGDPGRSAGGGRRVQDSEVLESATEVLGKYGLSPSDPEVVQLALTKKYDSLNDYLADLDAIGRRRSKQGKAANVSPAAVQPEGGFTPTDSYESLVQAYNDEMKTVRPGDIDARWRIKDKYLQLAKEKGINLPSGQ